VFANRCTGGFEIGAGEENAIKVANEAVKILHGWDQLKRDRKKRWFYPSLSHRKRA
jgi:uridine phosphorylase